jgi:hypothetical protein
MSLSRAEEMSNANGWRYAKLSGQWQLVEFREGWLTPEDWCEYDQMEVPV